MAETIITVRGEFSAFYPAERATVGANVVFDGPERAAVLASATAVAASVRDSINRLHDSSNGPVTWWASDSIRIWSDRPWSQTGEQLALVFHASIGFRVKFSDFSALVGWVETATQLNGVSIDTIEWALTEATRNAVTTEVRSRSVKDAVTKATVFAQSIGLGSVTAVALADPGMLGDQSGTAHDGGAEMRMMKVAGSSDDSGHLQLKPEEIQVSSVVDARFVAR
ncbi:MAG: SIMPL domain-containing protein [Microbacteriaceae bacterium]